MYVLFYKILLEVLFPVNSLIGVIGIPMESHNYENSIEVFTVCIPFEIQTFCDSMCLRAVFDTKYLY